MDAAVRNFVAMVAALPVGVFIFLHRRAQAGQHRPKLPWYAFGVFGLYVASRALMYMRGPSEHPDCFVVAFLVAAGVFLLLAVWKFFKDRQQFTLGTLMLVTSGVALFFSLSYYVSAVPLLIFLAFPSLVLAACGPPSLFVEDSAAEVAPSAGDRRRVVGMLERAEGSAITPDGQSEVRHPGGDGQEGTPA